MNFFGVMSLVAGLLQLIIAGYALRLNRIFGPARVGWSLFGAFSLLALLHFIQSMSAFNPGTGLGTEIEALYALIALLLLNGMVHREKLLRKRLRDKFPVDDQPAPRTEAVEDSPLEIAGRKLVEEQNSELARMLKLAPDAIMVCDPEDRIQFWNKQAGQIFGWSAAEAIGRKGEEVLPRDAINAAKYQEARKTVLKEGNWQGEFATGTKDGKDVNIESRWTLVRDDLGNPQSILSISNIANDKKNLVVQLQRAQRMESVGTVAGGIAHDFNNILAPFLVSIQILKGKLTDAERQKLLDALEVNIQRGAGRVKQVLAFGRGIDGERIPVQPGKIARDIQRVIQETFPKSIEFELQAASDLWPLVGDPTQIHQVLLNLCLNARDAMPDGGKLSLDLENQTFYETDVRKNPEARAGSYVHLRVTDTGTGIPKEMQERIFDPFFTTKKGKKGTGLGLSMALAIVKSHGGFINYSSERGRETVFDVYFPACVTPAAEPAAMDPSELSRGHNQVGLNVDDEEPFEVL